MNAQSKAIDRLRAKGIDIEQDDRTPIEVAQAKGLGCTALCTECSIHCPLLDAQATEVHESLTIDERADLEANGFLLQRVGWGTAVTRRAGGKDNPPYFAR